MLDGDELTTRLGESRRELFNLRFQLATGQLDNPSRIGQVRREVARMLTVLREREILEAEGAYVAPTAAEHEAARAKLAAEDAERRRRPQPARRRRRPRAADDGRWTIEHDHDTTTTTKRMRPDGRRRAHRERRRRKAAAAEDAEQALEAVEAEAATELPAGESTEAREPAPAPAASAPAAKARSRPRTARAPTAARCARASWCPTPCGDRRRGRGRAGAPPQLRQDGAAHQEALRARRRGQRQGGRPGPGAGDPARSPSSSAGA